jgi:hypothetical protein
MVIKCLDFFSSVKKEKKKEISFSSFLTRSLHGLVGAVELRVHFAYTFDLFFLSLSRFSSLLFKWTRNLKKK